jgi:hypothetical protein
VPPDQDGQQQNETPAGAGDPTRALEMRDHAMTRGVNLGVASVRPRAAQASKRLIMHSARGIKLANRKGIPMTRLLSLIFALALSIGFSVSANAGCISLLGAGKNCGAGGGAFTPGSLSPAICLEASQSTIFSDNGSTQITNGGAIQQWNDKSTSAHNLNNAGAGTKPVWNSATNPYVTFDGSAQFISGCFNLGLYSGAYTVTATVRATTASTNAYLFGGYQDNGNANTLLGILRASSGTATTASPLLRNDAGTAIENDGDLAAANALLAATDTVITITDDGAGNQSIRAAWRPTPIRGPAPSRRTCGQSEQSIVHPAPAQRVLLAPRSGAVASTAW